MPHFCPKHGRWGGDRKNRLLGLTLFHTFIWFKCNLLFSYFPHPGIILSESLWDKGVFNQVDQLCCWACISEVLATSKIQLEMCGKDLSICLQIAISGLTCSKKKKKASHYPIVYLPGERAAKCLHYPLNIHLFYLFGLYLDFLFCSLLVLIFCFLSLLSLILLSHILFPVLPFLSLSLYCYYLLTLFFNLW